MNVRFVENMNDAKVRHDTTVVADFIAIWCVGNHGDRDKMPVSTDAARLGVYDRKHPAVCAECEAHLAYAEKRRAYCPKDPKPFCAHCDTHCYKSEERQWQQEMMRFSGPKSWRHGHAIDGIRHMLEARAHKRQIEHDAATTARS